jgi:23S rRNA G2069 N7-methylase RlmK/C1962 C5-methylase RlmI
VTAALPLVKPGGILFASANAADWPPENFLADVNAAVHGAKRKILQRSITSRNRRISPSAAPNRHI